MKPDDDFGRYTQTLYTIARINEVAERLAREAYAAAPRRPRWKWRIEDTWLRLKAKLR